MSAPARQAEVNRSDRWPNREERPDMNTRALMSRRALLRTIAGGLASTAVVPLLAACGGDDDDDDPTATSGAAQPTSAGTPAGATPAAASPTNTTAAMATATSAPDAASPAASPTAATAPPTSAGGGDRLMGMQIEDAANEGGTLILATPYGGETVSPFDAFAYAYLAYELLAELHPETTEPVGNLAESWEVSGDGLTWTFTLREGVTWHDGEVFDADDVTTTYSIGMHPDNQYSWGFASLTSVETVGEQHVAMTLVEPLVDFISKVIAIWPIGPDHVWNGVDVVTLYEDPGVTGADPDRVVGTGPFRFVELVNGDHVSFERYDDYWDGTPHLDEVVYRIVPDPSAMSQMMRAGEIDVIPFPPGVDPAAVEELEGSDEVQLAEFPSDQLQMILFNLDEARTPLFQDVQVRKAMLHALDREALVEAVLFGFGEVADGVTTPRSWAYTPDSIATTYAYDPELAISLLEEAGWVEGPDGIRELDGQPFTFTGIVWEANLASISFAEAIQPFWREIGLDMQVQVETTAVFFEKLGEARDFELAVTAQYAGVDPLFAPAYLCESSEGGYCNAEVDELLAQAANENDQDTRLALYQQVTNILADELPVAPLAYVSGIAAVSSRVHNVFPNALNTLFNAETWWIEG